VALIRRRKHHSFVLMPNVTALHEQTPDEKPGD
jgi:hypothetical protein